MLQTGKGFSNVNPSKKLRLPPTFVRTTVYTFLQTKTTNHLLLSQQIHKVLGACVFIPGVSSC